MEEFYIEATADTPMIRLNPVTGVFEIKGKAVPEDAEKFFRPVLDWLEKYVEKPAKSTVLNLDLDYFNISSSKRILFILYKFNELAGHNLDVRVRWYYHEADEDMYEVGQDYAFMVKVPFEFISEDSPSKVQVAG
jgi:hypothetical protein